MVSQMLDKGKNIVTKMIKELQQRDVKLAISLEKNEAFFLSHNGVMINKFMERLHNSIHGVSTCLSSNPGKCLDVSFHFYGKIM